MEKKKEKSVEEEKEERIVWIVGKERTTLKVGREWKSVFTRSV